MSERLQNSPDLGKLKSKRSKELVERYAQQREQYYRTKNKGDRVTEEQRRIIDAEMDKKINELCQQETSKKQEAIAEISSIKSGLDNLNTNNVKNLDIPNFEFNDAIGFGSIQAIREQAQLYSNFNGEIHKKAENISTLYNQFMQIVNLFNKEREEDTRWSGDTDYENYVDAINGKIEEFKKLFADAEAELTKAVNKSDRAGQRLNEAPDNLRNTEGTNQEGTEGQFNEQNQIHNEQLQAYTQQGQRLQQGSQNLQQNQIFLNNYNDQLVQVTDALTVQKNQVDTTLLDWDNKKRNFKNIMNGLCSESNVSPFSDDELRQLISDPENFIKKIEPQERQQAALNLINAHGQELAEYVQIIDRYQTGVDQSMQISQGITEVQNRQTMVAQSQQDIENQQGIVSDEIVANNTRMQNLQQLMIESQNQHEQSIEYYHQNMDDIDYLDFEMSSIILDNDISNGGILESIANQRKSFNGLKVEAKGGWEKAWDSTVGMVCKGVNWTLDLVKDCVLFLPNLIQELGEKNPSIGESWLFKTLTLPLQIQAGISEGIIELTEGLFTMVEQPMATLNGLGQLIGRDAQTGEWSFGAARDAWLNFGKALIAYDDWGEGNDGRALGKGIANIGTIFIPMAGEFSAAANTAKVARVVGGVSKTRAALIGTTDFFTRTGSKVTRGMKGIGNNLRNIPGTVKRGLGYVDDVAKKGRTIASDLRETGGVTKYTKRGLESTRNTYHNALESTKNTYHNAGGVRGLGRQYLELGTGWTYVKGVKKLIKGEPLFGKKFPSLKKLPKERLKMEERLQKLRGQNGVGGEIESMYQKVSKYVDKNGDLLEGVKGSEIPVREWGKIADYQSAQQEIRSLEATISRYKQVETSLIDESGNYTKLGEFIQKNKNFGKTMEEILADPSKAKEIFAEFKKKNPKVDISALEDIEIFRDGGKIYRIKNGELVEGEGVIKPTKKTYTAEDYGLKPEIYDELVEQLYLKPGTAEFNAEAVSRGGKIPTQGKPIELETGAGRVIPERSSPIEGSSVGTEVGGTEVIPERPSPTIIELNYKGSKGTISERRVKEKDGGYRKFEGERGKYKRTETVLTEDEMTIKLKDVKSEGGTGIEVGKGTDIFEWAESKATEAGNRLTEVKKKPVEPISNKKSEILPSNLQEGDMLTRNGYDMKITKRIQNEGKVSYEFEYTEGGTTQKISMTAEELAGGWSDVTDIIRQQDIHIKGMNEYFTKNVASCRDKKLYIEGNEYTATKATDGTLHLTYSGGHNYPIRYEIKDGKLQMVRNKALQNDITVSSFNELKTKWNASPIDDGRTISGTLRENITELTADEAANVKFWNKLWKEEKDQAIKNIKRRPTEATEAKPVEIAVEVTSETEIPVVRNFSPEGGYKSPIDTFDELLNSPEGVTIEGVNYRWDFSEITNPPKHIHNKKWKPNIKLIVKDKNGVIHKFETKYKPGENIKPGELVQPTKVLPGPKVEWEMSADGKWYPKKVEELPSNAEDLIKTYYEARQKYVDHYNRSLPVRQGEGGAVVPVERTTIPPTSPEMKPPLIPDVPKWVSVAAIAILANKDKDETINIDVPGTTGFEWTPQDQKEVSELQELLSKNPTRQEVKDLIRGDKDAFKKLILVKDGVNGGANINFDILNYLVEQGKFNGLNGDIQEQLKHDVIKYIGLGDILEEGTTFTVTSTDGTKRSGKIVNNRAVDERGRYIPIFQGDHIESDALGFLDPIYPYNNTNSEGGTDPDTELENALEQI